MAMVAYMFAFLLKTVFVVLEIQCRAHVWEGNTLLLSYILCPLAVIPLWNAIDSGYSLSVIYMFSS